MTEKNEIDRKGKQGQKIIGIDPGTRVTGYGIIEKNERDIKIIDFGCIRPPKDLPLPERYFIIFNAVGDLLEQHAPAACVLETQFFRNSNPQSILKLGGARVSGILAAKMKQVPIFEYSPREAKRAVVGGDGFASKQQIQGMLQRLFGLKNPPSPFDAADALSLALCHSFRHDRLS